MCGIAGILALAPDGPPVDAEALRRMTAAMAVRGPDGQGEWIKADGRIGFGHRRLAVIDPSPAGDQPFFSEDGCLVIVFNGEIYNYRSLRADLEARGAVFRTGTDTEVLLELYRHDGPDMVGRLRGMYAFAIWDVDRQILFLARDPFGIKPLYLARQAGRIAFASQVSALHAGGMGGAPDPAALAGFLTLGFVPEPFTWLDGVSAFPAGCHMTIRRDGRETLSRHADLKSVLLDATLCGSEPGLFADALADSMRHHLVSDVPVGLFLSAGLDSGALLAQASALAGPGFPSLTLGFDAFAGTAADEVPAATAVAAAYGSRHTIARTGEDDFRTVTEGLLSAMDQPSVDGINTYLVSAAAQKLGWKVALSGLGGDELLGGYPSFTQVPRLARTLGPFAGVPALGRGLRQVLAPAIGRLTSPKWAGLLEYGSDIPSAWLLRRAVHMPWELTAFLPADLVRTGFDRLDLRARLTATTAGIDDPYLQVMLLEMEWYMRSQLLRDADWAGMAHGVEIRVPLVDYGLFRDLAPSLVGAARLTKRDLAATTRPPLPRHIVDRPKTGFNVPLRAWAGGTREKGGGDGRRAWSRRLLDGRWRCLLEAAAGRP